MVSTLDEEYNTDRSSSLEHIPNGEHIFHSQPFVLENSSTELTVSLSQLTQLFSHNPKVYSEDPQGTPNKIVDKNLEFLAQELASSEEVLTYVIDHVIPKTTGVLNDEYKKELRKQLQDARQWDFVDATTLENSPESVSSEMAELFGSDNTEESRLHVDGFKSGLLRILMSPHKSPTLRRGWHSIENDNSPVPAPSQISERVDAPSGSLILFESTTGVHARPDLTKSDVVSFGGKRQVLSLTVDFSRVLSKTREILGQRRTL